MNSETFPEDPLLIKECLFKHKTTCLSLSHPLVSGQDNMSKLTSLVRKVLFPSSLQASILGMEFNNHQRFEICFKNLFYLVTIFKPWQMEKNKANNKQKTKSPVTMMYHRPDLLLLNILG